MSVNFSLVTFSTLSLCRMMTETYTDLLTETFYGRDNGDDVGDDGDAMIIMMIVI